MSVTRIEAELAAAIERANALRKQLQVADEWVAALQSSLHALRCLNSSQNDERSAHGQLIADAAWLILDVAGRRISSADLVLELQAQGIDVGAGNKENLASNVATQIQRYGYGLIMSPRLGWGLVEWGDETAPGPGPRQETNVTLDGLQAAP